MRKECLECGYWDKNKHKYRKCYTDSCPAKQIQNRAKRNSNLLNSIELPTKVYFKSKVITIQIPYCPKCHKQISIVEDIDARSIMTYHCDHCHYSQ